MQAPREMRPRSALRVVRSAGSPHAARIIRCLRAARRRAVVGTAHHPTMAAATGGPRCAAFVGTALNSKACPQNFDSVKTEAACQSLATISSKSYVGSVNIVSFPPRCFWLNVGGGVYWNTHANGGPNPNAQQLCAGAPAPPWHP
jgi:hypothetical protein